MLPSSRHLSHDFKAYMELTLRELFFISVISTVATTLLFTLIGFWMRCAVAMGSFGFLLGFIIATTILPKPIARFKSGKPHGFIVKKIRLFLASLRLKKSPFLYYTGTWQKSKRLRGHHV